MDQNDTTVTYQTDPTPCITPLLIKPQPKLYCPNDFQPPKADTFTKAHIKMFFQKLKIQIRKHTHKQQQA